MSLVLQVQVNEHVDYWHMKLMHIADVFHLTMLENYHRYEYDDGVVFGIDYRDCVPMVKHKISLDDVVQLLLIQLDHNDRESLSNEMVSLEIKEKI